MNTLINVVKFFGKELNWNSLATLIVIIVIQAILLALEIYVIIRLISRARVKESETVKEKPAKTETVAEQPVQREVVYVESAKETGERVLTGITLDVRVVQREFAEEEQFNCEGLIINAHYGVDGTESIEDYSVVNRSTYNRLERRNRLDGCYVIEPDMNDAGRKAVEVRLDKLVAKYLISIGEPAPQTEEEAQQELQPQSESVRTLLYISLDADNVQKEYTAGDSLNFDGLAVYANFSAYPLAEEVYDYTVIAPDMSKAGRSTVTVSYQDKTVGYQIRINPAPAAIPEPQPQPTRKLLYISLDADEVQKEFTAGDALDHEGLVVYGNYNTEPFMEEIDDYTVIAPDMNKAGKPTVTVTYQDRTVGYPITIHPAPTAQPEPLPEPVRYLMYISLDTDKVQKEFTAGDALNHEGLVVYGNYNTEPSVETIEDYTVIAPDMNKAGKPTVTVTYQDRTVGYPITINPAPEVEREPEVVYHEPIIVEEESLDTRLRYDKSFIARMIQSDDEVKHWYNELKNELLSYNKTKGRISWKRETFKAGRNMVAKLAFRGMTLCVYYPLDPNEYLGSEFPVEYVGEIPANADTPTMLRIKNHRRVKLAIKLLAEVAKIHGLERAKQHTAEDFYMPYEGTLELINRGLIKRDIKTAEEEAIFERDKFADEDEEEVKTSSTSKSAGLKEVAPGVYVTPKK